ncbi:hypothetical protein DFJ74DRAFT_647025 [Hyaloraphidium curvatum]|nr:hypothetical protein DFJ74DRAFT_647025 [Hyaloraphidium curvatum]
MADGAAQQAPVADVAIAGGAADGEAALVPDPAAPLLLPNELLERIMGLLASEGSFRALLNLALAERRMWLLAQPVLYETLDFPALARRGPAGARFLESLALAYDAEVRLQHVRRIVHAPVPGLPDVVGWAVVLGCLRRGFRPGIRSLEVEVTNTGAARQLHSVLSDSPRTCLERLEIATASDMQTWELRHLALGIPIPPSVRHVRYITYGLINEEMIRAIGEAAGLETWELEFRPPRYLDYYGALPSSLADKLAALAGPMHLARRIAAVSQPRLRSLRIDGFDRAADGDAGIGFLLALPAPGSLAFCRSSPSDLVKVADLLREGDLASFPPQGIEIAEPRRPRLEEDGLNAVALAFAGVDVPVTVTGYTASFPDGQAPWALAAWRDVPCFAFDPPLPPAEPYAGAEAELRAALDAPGNAPAKDSVVYHACCVPNGAELARRAEEHALQAGRFVRDLEAEIAGVGGGAVVREVLDRRWGDLLRRAGEDAASFRRICGGLARWQPGSVTAPERHAARDRVAALLREIALVRLKLVALAGQYEQRGFGWREVPDVASL